MRKRDLELQKKMFLLVDQWKTGNKSQKQISAENGIKLTTFKYWRTTYEHLNGVSRKDEKSSFHKIQRSLIKKEHKSELNVELEYPNGVKLKIDNSNTELLKTLINILS
jgi:GTPase SAR1 family protein